MPTREPDCSCGRGPSMVQGKWYGVRSYLHLFYEDCTGASPDGDGDRSSPHGAWAPLIWKVSLSTGTLFLLVGAAALAAGSFTPPGLQPAEAKETQSFTETRVRRDNCPHTLQPARRARVFFPIQKSVTLSPTPDFQVRGPWARHRWLWAQHSNGGGAGLFPDTSFHQTSPLPAREGCSDREGPSSGFRGKSAVQTWVPTP
ncbi:NRSN2 protein, partial [Sagittarius serpentarius]|nr:NRSN2 protein [Sagittarius serpentarius]